MPSAQSDARPRKRRKLLSSSSSSDDSDGAAQPVASSAGADDAESKKFVTSIAYLILRTKNAAISKTNEIQKEALTCIKAAVESGASVINIAFYGNWDIDTLWRGMQEVMKSGIGKPLCRYSMVTRRNLGRLITFYSEEAGELIDWKDVAVDEVPSICLTFNHPEVGPMNIINAMWPGHVAGDGGYEGGFMCNLPLRTQKRIFGQYT